MTDSDLKLCIQVLADEENNFAFDNTQAVGKFGPNSTFQSSLDIDEKIRLVNCKRKINIYSSLDLPILSIKTAIH